MTPGFDYPLEKLYKRFEFALRDYGVDSIEVALETKGATPWPSGFGAEVYVIFDQDYFAMIRMDSKSIDRDDKAEKFLWWRIADSRAKRGIE